VRREKVGSARRVRPFGRAKFEEIARRGSPDDAGGQRSSRDPAGCRRQRAFPRQITRQKNRREKADEDGVPFGANAAAAKAASNSQSPMRTVRRAHTIVPAAAASSRANRGGGHSDGRAHSSR